MAEGNDFNPFDSKTLDPHKSALEQMLEDLNSPRVEEVEAVKKIEEPKTDSELEKYKKRIARHVDQVLHDNQIPPRVRQKINIRIKGLK